VPPQDETRAPNGITAGQSVADPHERRRAALLKSVPETDDTTPLAAQLAEDARRRIKLQGTRFPKPQETRIFTIANQKGGVGKTTTAVNVAAALATGGLNVLVIDNDPQGNASTALGIEHQSGVPSIYDVIIDDVPLGDVLQPCESVPGLVAAPATIDLSGAEIELVSMVARENRLRNAIRDHMGARKAQGLEPYDYILIDCPPSLGLLTINAFVAAREVLIPIQCEYYALEGLTQLLKNIELIRGHLNTDLHVSTILLTMFDGRTNLAREVAEEVRGHFPVETLEATIPRSVRISEAPSYGQTVLTYDPGSTGALAYREAAHEMAKRGAEANTEHDGHDAKVAAESEKENS
jgi:chromosome partitioning protein